MTGPKPPAWLTDWANIEGWLKTDWDAIRAELAKMKEPVEACRRAKSWPDSEGLI